MSSAIANILNANGTPSTAQRHLEFTLAQQVIQKIEVLIAGYPPPHVLWPGWQLDDESDALTRRSPDDPPDFELAEEDADMEDGPDDPPDSPRSCVRVEVSRNYWPMCAHGQDLSAYIASGAGRGE